MPRRFFAALAAAAAVTLPATAAAAVPLGTPVVARLHPTNNVIAGITDAAQRAHLGAVTAVGFTRDCTPLTNTVVVCRDLALDKTGRALVTATPTSCVVALDPRIGGASRARRVLRPALKSCITR